jgi:hypothetical protein
MSLWARHCPLQPKKKNLDVGFSWLVGDKDEPPNLSSSFRFFSSLVKDNHCRNPTLAKCEDETHTPKVGDLESSGTPEFLEFDS